VLAHLSPVLQAAATFAYYTGWRRSEIVQLDWQRVDRQACIVRLERRHDEEQRRPRVSLRRARRHAHDDEQMWAAHETLKKAGTICPLVFQRFDGKPIASFRKAWKAACAAAGCPGRIVHDFRRTAVRNLERAGVSRSVAMKVTGHKTEAVYRRYAIVSSGDLAEAARKLQHMTTTGTVSGTIGQSDAASDSSKALA
jgi:integrase